jgi:uncharacterized protein DUF6484
MASRSVVEDDELVPVDQSADSRGIHPAIETPASPAERSPATSGSVIGEVIGFANQGRTPLVCYRGQPGSAALSARTVVDLHSGHIGRDVVLVFDAGDPAKPIVMGILCDDSGWPLADPPAHVQVDADGARMVVAAKQELVLRCGKASITMTKSGKVLIQGTYVSNRSSGVMRIKGGSIELN